MEIIHIVLGKANPERMNGVNRVVYEMATSQVKFGYPVQVWGITGIPKHDYPARQFETRLYQKHKWAFTADAGLLKDLYEKRMSIVVHFHGAFIPAFYTLSRFLQKYNIPCFITPHSSYNKVVMKKNALIKKIYFLFFEKKLLNYCSAIHLLGKTEWDGLESIYNNDKSVLIPYGFNHNTDLHSEIQKRGVFTICYCGRLSIYTKGLDILFRGFTLFNKRFPESEMIVIGDGREKAELEKMCTDLQLRASVHFRGSLFGSEKIRVISSCQVFAHPSRTDGIPATIVEAAALGLPCIVSQATNVGDYISQYDAGILLNENTPECFCEGLTELYHRMRSVDGEKQLRYHAIQMIGEVFNWQDILIRFDALYESAFRQKQMSGKVQLESPLQKFQMNKG